MRGTRLKAPDVFEAPRLKSSGTSPKTPILNKLLQAKPGTLNSMGHYSRRNDGVETTVHLIPKILGSLGVEELRRRENVWAQTFNLYQSPSRQPSSSWMDLDVPHALPVEKKHTRIYSLVAPLHAQTSDRCGSVMVPVNDYHGWFRADRRHVVPIEDPKSPSVRDKKGVLDYAKEGGEVSDMFGDFCRQNLCMESWEFIMDSVAYKVYRSASL